jgi:hypothetical protein
VIECVLSKHEALHSIPRKGGREGGRKGGGRRGEEKRGRGREGARDVSLASQEMEVRFQDQGGENDSRKGHL